MTLYNRQIKKVTDFVESLPSTKKDGLIEVIVEGTPRYVKILMTDGSIYFFRPGSAETWTGRSGEIAFGLDNMLRTISRRLTEIERHKGLPPTTELTPKILYLIHKLREARVEVERCSKDLNNALIESGEQIDASKL
jgi:hypothetical protein